MIIDNIANAGSYTNLHPLFKQALDYINNTDLLTIETGKHPIGEGLTAIISDKMGVTAAESAAKFECHDRFIDIQLCIRPGDAAGMAGLQRTIPLQLFRGKIAFERLAPCRK